jgi:hypothetical protein
MKAAGVNKDRVAGFLFRFYELQSDAGRLHYRHTQAEADEPSVEVDACIDAAFDAMSRIAKHAEDLRGAITKRARLKLADVRQIAEVAESSALALREAMELLAEQAKKLEAAGETARSRVTTGSQGLLELAEIELAGLRAEVTA